MKSNKTQGEAVFEEGSEKEPWAAAQKPIQRGAFTASSLALVDAVYSFRTKRYNKS